jgi:DNA repair photolyase
MSPVHSLSAPRFRMRSHRAVKSTAGLFPENPEVRPVKVVSGLAPVADQRSSISDPAAPDCPPAPGTVRGAQVREMGRVRNVAAEPPAKLVGIARLAASSKPAESKRKSLEKPEYFVLPVKSILNRCDSDRVPFEWTINPYRGCEFACKYCYARYTHEYMELDGGEFEKKIYVKKDAAPLLAWDVGHKYSYASEASGGERPDHIAIGTATDPYQPAEREYGVTRACLEELSKKEGLSISIITKSNQVVRDIDVLQRIAERSNLAIDMTITTLRAGLTRLLEPRAPRPDLRLAAVKQLTEAGLAVGVSASPLIPGITDRDGDLEAVAAAAREAGAQWFFSGVLFLMPASARQFLPFLAEKFPRLSKQYEQWYAKSGYMPEEYRKKAAERVARIRQTYGFRSRPWVDAKRSHQCVQLSLALTATSLAASAVVADDSMRSCSAG